MTGCSVRSSFLGENHLIFRIFNALVFWKSHTVSVSSTSITFLEMQKKKLLIVKFKVSPLHKMQHIPPYSTNFVTSLLDFFSPLTHLPQLKMCVCLSYLPKISINFSLAPCGVLVATIILFGPSQSSYLKHNL